MYTKHVYSSQIFLKHAKRQALSAGLYHEFRYFSLSSPPLKELAKNQTHNNQNLFPYTMQQNNSNINEMPDIMKIVEDLQSQIKAMTCKLNLDKEIFNSEEAAAFLGITKSQLYKLTHQQLIPFFKPTGKLIMFERQELIDWVKRGRVMSNAELNEATQSKLQSLAI